MSDEVELSEGGFPVYRHESRTKGFETAAGDGESIQAIGAHIDQHLGQVDMVYHEIVSDLVHIDVHHVKPRPGRLFHTLVTSGMSDRPMAAPPGAEGFQYAELLMCLPHTWPISEASFKDENYYWPVRTLKMLARFPHEYDTWLGWGHTIPHDNAVSPYAPSTKLCCSLLLPPVLAPPEFPVLEISPEKTVHFYALVPLYREEMDFKLKRGTEPLCDLFDKAGVNELVDITRKNVCKRSLWPF